MKQKFTLSRSNTIYFGVVAALSFCYCLAMPHDTPERPADWTVASIIWLLIPSFIAWVVWSLSGRNKNGGSIVFNIVLTLILLGQLQHRGAKRQNFQEVMQELDQQVEVATQSWIESSQQLTETFNAVSSPRILDVSLLNTDEEFDYQKSVIWLHVQNARAAKLRFANLIYSLRKRASIFGEETEHTERAVEEAIEQYRSQEAIVEPLMRAHIEYGENMLRMLDLLQKNKDEWSYENDELQMFNDNVSEEYDKLLEALGSNEATITSFAGKFAEEL